MPRFTNTNYLEAHRWLRQFWLADLGAYADVSERDQIELHLYFCPSKDWSDEKLLDHRQAMSKADPSLPQRAGRALKRFEQAQAGEVVYSPPVYVMPGRGRQKGHAISVRAVRRPEPDLQKLTRALIQLAKDEQLREQQDKGAA